MDVLTMWQNKGVNVESCSLLNMVKTRLFAHCHSVLFYNFGIMYTFCTILFKPDIIMCYLNKIKNYHEIAFLNLWKVISSWLCFFV